MAQSWRNLLFAHWPLHPSKLRDLIPGAMQLDLWAGEAWIGVVPFRMDGIRLRGAPALPYVSSTLELNVRTYVTVNEKPGVYFFSLDAQSKLAVRVARRFFHLPYFDARMSCREDANGFHYASTRVHRGAPEAAFEAEYAPIGAAVKSLPGTLEYFLTERYRLYTTDSKNTLYRGDIQHEPWRLQPARASILKNTMSGPLAIALDSAPVLHFAKRLDVRIRGLARC